MVMVWEELGVISPTEASAFCLVGWLFLHSDSQRPVSRCLRVDKPQTWLAMAKISYPPNT